MASIRASRVFQGFGMSALQRCASIFMISTIVKSGVIFIVWSLQLLNRYTCKIHPPDRMIFRSFLIVP